MDDEISRQIAVRDLIHRYSDTVTRRDFVCMGTLFTDDAVWQAASPFNLRFEGAGIAQSLGAALKGYEMLFQVSLNSVIDVEGDRASGRTMIFEMGKEGDTQFQQWGLYEDAMVREDGRWRFASRLFNPLYRDNSPFTGTAFPLQLGSGK